jgi:hypothetical protein
MDLIPLPKIPFLAGALVISRRSDITNYFKQEYEIHCILEKENGSTSSSAGFSMCSPTASHSQFFFGFLTKKNF